MTLEPPRRPEISPWVLVLLIIVAFCGTLGAAWVILRAIELTARLVR